MDFMLRLKKQARAVLVSAAAASMVLANIASVSAQTLSSASLNMSDPRPSETGVTYTFDASNYAATSIQCIELEFATTATGGTPVTGIDTTGATFDASGTLVTETNWTSDFATNGTLTLTYATGETPAASGSLVFTGIDNGSVAETTYYGLLNTYSDDTCTTAVDDVIVAFVYTNGEPVTLTIEPTLTFAVAGVASGSVNGASITADTTSGSIDFGNNVTASTNGVSAHDIDVTTNATSGYVVYIRHTGQLTNQSSDTIDNHAGTNLSPTTFTAAGTESWGYTTEDATLTAVGDGADRFTNAGNEWAGFTTSNEPVIENAAATAGTETTRVGHQVGVASDTEAGTYQTTVVYTVVGTF